MRTYLTAATMLALAIAFVGGDPAWAASNRVWVSGHGVDQAGCGSPTSPCRSLQYSHDNVVAAGGEIDILDPAGYGAITITKAVSIVNDGVGTAGVQATSGNAITIVAGVSDAVTLRGLNIDGLGSAHDGIGLTQAGALTVANCFIRHFAHDGMDVQTTNQMTLSVIGVTAADNANDGFDIAPTGAAALNAVVDHSYAINNGADGVGISGASGFLNVTVDYGDFSDNAAAGIVSHGGGKTRVVAKGNVLEYNNRGYYVQAGSTMVISQSLAFYNADVDLLLDFGAEVFTYGDNQINSTRPGTGTVFSLAPF